ncbi:MAG: epoxyqueuosine reductase [Lentisphaerae bacterium]|nr:epoxyqueuosine reductase [Lentisphaerota bacterium]
MHNGTTDRLKTELENIAAAMGAKVFGIADLEALLCEHPHFLDHVPGRYSRAIVMGVRLQKSVLDGIRDKPTPLYFHHYRQVNYQLDRIALMIADRLQDLGHVALAAPASQVISRTPMFGHVSHRLLGRAAGLGFIGRNGLLVNPRYGAQVRYVSVLTDAFLEADVEKSGNCGSCRRCIDACPAGAIGENAEDFNQEACYAKLTEFTKLPFIGQHICGVCVKQCSGPGNG